MLATDIDVELGLMTGVLDRIGQMAPRAELHKGFI